MKKYLPTTFDLVFALLIVLASFTAYKLVEVPEQTGYQRGLQSGSQGTVGAEKLIVIEGISIQYKGQLYQHVPHPERDQ